MTGVGRYAGEMIGIVLSMTFSGSAMALALFLFKPLWQDRLPKAFQYYMWLPVVLALLIPISEIIAFPADGSPIVSTGELARRIADAASETSVNSAFALSKEMRFPSAAVILSVIWQIGMMLVLGFYIVCYVSYVRRLGRYNRDAKRWETELLNGMTGGKLALRLYKNKMVETPMLIGFFRAAVILPDKTYGVERLRNILRHETVHWRRHDIFVKWLLIFVGAVHWFNPIVFCTRREINKACELACDEAAIKGLDVDEMQQYGDALIAAAEDSVKKTPLWAAMFEEKKNLKERLGAIMKHKTYSKRTVAAACVILAVCICAILGFHALRSTAGGYVYADNFSSSGDQRNIIATELENALCGYDEKNIVEADVFLGDSGDEVTNAYIIVVFEDEDSVSETLAGLQSLAAEKLGLDIQSIHIDYTDAVSYLSDEPKFVPYS